MKKITTTAANQKFTKMLRDIESEKIFGITKKDEIKYVIMTIDKYNELNTKGFSSKLKEGFWIKTAEGTIYKVKEDNGLTVTGFDEYEGEPVTYIEAYFSSPEIIITEDIEICIRNEGQESCEGVELDFADEDDPARTKAWALYNESKEAHLTSGKIIAERFSF